MWRTQLQFLSLACKTSTLLVLNKGSQHMEHALSCSSFSLRLFSLSISSSSKNLARASLASSSFFFLSYLSSSAASSLACLYSSSILRFCSNAYYLALSRSFCRASSFSRASLCSRSICYCFLAHSISSNYLFFFSSISLSCWFSQSAKLDWIF